MNEKPTLHSMRLLELDALRGLAALSVVLFHYTTRYQELYGHTTQPLVRFDLGHHGVNLFFMISGFVIFMTLNKTRRTADFVISRFSRLYPTYWAAVCITFALMHRFELPGKAVPIHVLAVNLTMFQEMFGVKHVDNVYWTLQVELIFYLLMLGLFHFRQLKRIELILFIWLGVRLAYLILPSFAEIEPSYVIGKLLIQSFIPFFALGIVFFRMRETENRSTQHIALIIASMLLIYFGEGFDVFLVACLFTAIFWSFISGRLTILTAAPLVFLGTISYSLYLLHENIGWAIIYTMEQRGDDTHLAIAVALLMSLALATAMTYLVEKPALKAIRGFWKRRQSRPPDSR